MADLGAIGVDRSHLSTHDANAASGAVRRAAYSRYRAPTLPSGGVNRALRYQDTTEPATYVFRGPRAFRPIPWWVSDSRPIISVPIDGKIAGTLLKEGVALPDGYAHLYHRATGTLVARQKVSAGGGFLFTGLDTGDYYFVLGFDTAVPPTVYNAKVLDFLSPVPL